MKNIKCKLKDYMLKLNYDSKLICNLSFIMISWHLNELLNIINKIEYVFKINFVALKVIF
jgi:hypothetical protein